MQIGDGGADSACSIASELVAAGSDDDFVTKSKRFADRLVSAQLYRTIPGGIVVVFSGTVGAASLPYAAVLKAETQAGFQKEIADGRLSMTFVQELFLTPATRLYKIGMFVREAAAREALPAGWAATVYDSQMSATKRDGAAQYFYENFLGCSIPENSARLVRTFFESTRQFIRDLDLPAESRADMLTSLYTYLKVDQTPTVEVAAFSNSYIPADHRDNYRAFMQGVGLPMTAIAKDISEIGNALRQRKFVFPNNIKLTAPPEAFHDMITIEAVPPDGADPRAEARWTRITIRDRIREIE